MLGYICTVTLFHANTKRMTLKFLPFKATLNKAYQKLKPTRSEMERFKAGLVKLLENIDHSESEENHKFHLQNFFNEVWYKDAHLIAPKGNIDLVIHEDRSAQSPAVVLFEVKRERNLGEMIRPDSPNAKALHELMLYYLRERVDAGNIYVKHLVITNIYDWYIFDGATFDRLFYQNKKLLKDYDRWRNDRTAQHTTDFFYKDIAKRHLEEMDGTELVAAHFNLREYLRFLPLNPKGGPTDTQSSELQNKQSTEGSNSVGSPLGVRGQDDVKLIPLFKILSPQHLLRLPFANDSNSLNEGFYRELLYLIGLEEEKEGGKKLIRRCAPERRHAGSLLENTINIIQYEDRMRHVRSNDVFEVALELCITWVNRLLFLKLLESQLVKYHGGDPEYRFLTSKLIKDFDGLNKLFFQVLAEKVENRPAAVQAAFAKVPYLNSSLFEITEMEGAAIRINSLEDELTLPLHPKSVLRQNTHRVTQSHPVSSATLSYFFDFLDAYDFASEGSEEVQEENKALINASVLGLIFEKINGYRDGSFFTPGFITMYMCRETVRRAVVQKFNQHYGLDCTDFSDLCNFTTRHYKREEILADNQLVNSLRICDPAVGSGHFLVSALNELIAVKSELGILADADGNVLRGYAATVENDELVLTCNDGQDLFEYRTPQPPKGGDSPSPYTPLKGAGGDAQRVQQTIFHEKQTIIENCLFGVDINPNSVKICRLRLWIELLKHTYYRVSDGVTSSHPVTPQLETLPNIDINIKTGNSLISRFALDTDLSKVVKSRNEIQDYRRYVQEYHHATDKETKRGLLAMIDKLKGDFRTEITNKDPLFLKHKKAVDELHKLTTQFSLFGMTEAEDKKRKADIEKLGKEIEKLDAQIKAIKENKIYEHAFEWRFEFPEVLDMEGRFVGFDVVVGNPPYMRVRDEISNQTSYFKSNYKVAENQVDTFHLFIEKSYTLLHSSGISSMIIPNTLLGNSTSTELRKFVLDNFLVDTIADIRGDVFKDASVEVLVFLFCKSKTKQAKSRYFEVYEKQFQFIHFFEPDNFHQTDNYNFTVTLSGNKINLINKIRAHSWQLSEICDSITGIKEYQVGKGNPPQNQFQVQEKVFNSNQKKDDTYIPELRGKNINKYSIDWQGEYISYGEWLAEPRHLDYFLDEKILIRQIPSKNSLIVGITHQDFIIDQSVFVVKIKDGILEYTYEYICGLLNSKLVFWYFQNFFNEFDALFPKIKAKEVRALPLSKNNIYKPQITALVTQILAAKQGDTGADTSALEREVDRLVYGLYGLGEEEIEIIENKN
ncbi:MAG: N-6 DNA methylase [Bacteroidetes bacterium]|nr:N-6 DNA methylase [Bacteroidota bacterium]